MSKVIKRQAFRALRERVAKQVDTMWCDLLRPLTGWAPWRIQEFVRDKSPEQIRAFVRKQKARTT